MTSRLESERMGLALLAIVGLVLSLFALFGASPARADHANEAIYEFNFVNGAMLSGSHGPGGEAPIPFSFFEAYYGVGNVPEGFEGLSIHVSCSDVFTDGWGDAGFPDETDHPEWQIADYSIVRHTPGNTKPCEETFVTTTQPEVTTTTQPEVTTTTQPEVTTTTVAGTTTTVADTTTTTIAGTTITAPPSTLPFTGIESEQMVGIAIMLLGSGILLTVIGMGRREEI